MKVFKRIACMFKDHVLKFEKTYTSGFDVYTCYRCNKKFANGADTNYVLIPFNKESEEICDEAEAKVKALNLLGGINFPSVDRFLKSVNFVNISKDNELGLFTEDEREELKKMYEREKKDDDT
jgi:hypothetical protein